MGAHPRHRILIIDDRSEVRSLLSDLLALLDCEVDQAADGAEGVARFAQGGYDVVVTDLVMPGMSGWEVIDSLQRRDPTVAVIIMSGSATSLDVERARTRGVNILHKPLAMADFAMAVEGVLEQRAHCDR